ncbi:MAG: biopolymer transporter ExbD [Luteolibacter sp.]
MPLSYTLVSLAAATLWLVISGLIWISIPWKRRIFKVLLGAISICGTLGIIAGGSVAAALLNDKGKTRQELSNASAYVASDVRRGPARQQLRIEIIDANRVALNGTTVSIERLDQQLKTDLKVPPSQASVSLTISSSATEKDISEVKSACSRAGISEVMDTAAIRPGAHSSRF